MNNDFFASGRRYGAIMADPAWTFTTYSKKGKGRSPEQHYDCMTLDDIKALPVADIAAEDCALFLWACDPLLPQALEVIKAWGFTFKTVGFYWAKKNRKSEGFFTSMGYWTRANPEQCLMATRGKPERLAKDVRRLIVEPVREHSRKPDSVRDSIERLVPGPYAELFARTTREGWDSWGNEVDRFESGNVFVEIPRKTSKDFPPMNDDVSLWDCDMPSLDIHLTRT